MDDSGDSLSPAPAPPDTVRVAPRLDPRLPAMREGANGGSLYRGGVPAALRPDHSPAKLGRKVRDGMAFARKMRKLADSPATARALRTILCDPDHDLFMRAVEYVTDRGYGRVPQRVEAEHSHLHAVVLLPSMDQPPVAVVPALSVDPAPVVRALPTVSAGSGTGQPDGQPDRAEQPREVPS